MRVLVACEFSGIVRDAFIRRGHDAVSCDLKPSLRPGPHFQRDIRSLLDVPNAWDLMVAFPPCIYLTVANAPWGKFPAHLQEEALAFVAFLMNAPVERICIENPLGAINSRIRKCDQYIHPFMFGHPYRKRTCLWLTNLPLLHPTKMVEPTKSWVNSCDNTKNSDERLLTFDGVAAAMAEQWGRLENQ